MQWWEWEALYNAEKDASNASPENREQSAAGYRQVSYGDPGYQPHSLSEFTDSQWRHLGYVGPSTPFSALSVEEQVTTFTRELVLPDELLFSPAPKMLQGNPVFPYAPVDDSAPTENGFPPAVLDQPYYGF